MTSASSPIAGSSGEVDLATKLRIEQYLANITPEIRRVEPLRLGRSETLEFRQRAPERDGDWRFQSDQVSEGTLRALGVLVALFQARVGKEPVVSLVGIEEPENALHPAAAGVLLDALQEASETTQILVTSHSPALLDNDEIDIGILRAVVAERGRTSIGSVDAASRQALDKHLYTAGELLRMDQLRPESGSADSAVEAMPTLLRRIVPEVVP